MNVTSEISSRAANRIEVLDDPREHPLVEVDQVHLVHAHHEMRDAQQRADERMAPGLREHPLARVDQHDRQIGGRGAGDHVARVLLVAGGVGDDEPALGRGEVAVGDVDRDALLALGPQPVGQQRQVEEVASPSACWSARRAPADRRAPAWSRTAAARSACSCRRPPSPRWRTAAARPGARRAARKTSWRQRAMRGEMRRSGTWLAVRIGASHLEIALAACDPPSPPR